MVGIGTAFLFLGLWAAYIAVRRRDVATRRWFLRAAAVSGVAAVVALESGWIVTEVGRQPWVVYLVLRTADAVTHSAGVQLSFYAVVALYSALGIVTVVALRAMSRRWAVEEAPADAPASTPSSGSGA